MSKQWFETTVKIKVEGDGCTLTGGAPPKVREIEVPAIGCRDVPGLVYHVQHNKYKKPRLPESGEKLRVTHTRSGKFVLPALRTRKAVRRAILELGKLTDWTKSEQDVITLQIGEKIREMIAHFNREGQTA